MTDAWLVIPLYNEAQVVADVIESAREVFPYVVAVDDGSKDASARQAERAGAIVVRHPINRGQGAALQTGIDYVLEKTNADYMVTFDADGQHSPDDARAMVAAARAEGLGFVLGSRFLEGPSPVGPAKRLVLALAAKASSRSSGMRMTDAHNGLRVLRRDAAEQISLQQDRMAHASEIIRQLAAEGTAILLVSSELPELLGLADRIVVMHEGRVNATLPPADFNPQTIMAAATGQPHAHA